MRKLLTTKNNYPIKDKNMKKSSVQQNSII